jgi:hypothetical protein
MKRRAGRTTLLDPHEDRLQQRWNEGCRNGQQLYRELKADGYSGGRTSVTRYVTGFGTAVVCLPAHMPRVARR